MHSKFRAKSVLLLYSIVPLAFSFEFTGIPNPATVGTSFSATLNRDSSDLANFVLGYFVNDSTSFPVIQSFESDNATVIPFQFTPTGPGVYVMGVMPMNSGDLIAESSNFNVLAAQLPSSLPQTFSSSSSLPTSVSTSTPDPGTTATSQAQVLSSSAESLSSSPSTSETSISGTATGPGPNLSSLGTNISTSMIASDTSFTSGISTTNPSKRLSFSQPMTTTASQGSTAPSGPNTPKSHEKQDLIAIIGVLVGGFIILITGVVIILWKRNQRRRHSISPFTEGGSHEQKLKRPLFEPKSSVIGMIADPALHNLNASNGRKSRSDLCRNARQRRSPLENRSEFGLENTAPPMIGTIGLGRVGGGENAELFEHNGRVDELELPPEYYSVCSA